MEGDACGFCSGPRGCIRATPALPAGLKKLGGRALQVPCQMMWRLCDGCVCRVALWFVFAGQSCATARKFANVDKDATRGEGWEKPPCKLFAATKILQKCCREKLQHFCNIPATFFLGDSILQHFCNIPATFPQHPCNIALATKSKLHCNKLFVASVARVNKTDMLQ